MPQPNEERTARIDEMTTPRHPPLPAGDWENMNSVSGFKNVYSLGAVIAGRVGRLRGYRRRWVSFSRAPRPVRGPRHRLAWLGAFPSGTADVYCTYE